MSKMKHLLCQKVSKCLKPETKTRSDGGMSRAQGSTERAPDGPNQDILNKINVDYNPKYKIDIYKSIMI